MDSGRASVPIGRVYSSSWQRWLQIGAALGLFFYVAILPALYFEPKLALRMLWFVFIPLAPMFLLAAPNAWVSLCPVSTVQTLTRRFGWMGGARLSNAASRRLQKLGWVLMFLGIPSRHLLFNTNGSSVFVAATAVSLVALGLGFVFFSLSGWCVGACPIRPVEVIYGQFALDSNRPEKCTQCTGCVAPCVRTKPREGASEFADTRWVANLVYGFPGFVAAYFVIDLFGVCTSEEAFFAGTAAAPTDWRLHAALVYSSMALGFLVSLAVFLVLGRLGASAASRFRWAAIAAYVCYYCGVAPEIVIAWGIDPAWQWLMLALPLSLLAFVLVRQPRGQPVLD